MKLSGIVAAPVTPMSADGQSLSTEAELRTYLTFLLERGVCGMLLGGTTGEGMLLTTQERKTLAERGVGIVSHAVPVFIQIGSNSTAESIELARHAAAIGAEGIAVVAPSFYSYDVPALSAHFTLIARSVPNLPVYLYNLPSFTHNEILPELILDLRRACPNILGIKHSDADLVRLQEYRRLAGADFCILSGNDAVEYAALALGADGCVSGKSSVFPEVTIALFRAFHANDLPAARAQQIKIDLLATVLDLGVGLDLPYFKAALRWRGLGVGGLRLPQRPLNPEEETVMRQGLERLEKQGVLNDLLAL